MYKATLIGETEREAEFVTSLRGPRGEAGPAGPAGPVGPQGPKGADGTMTFEDVPARWREQVLALLEE